MFLIVAVMVAALVYIITWDSDFYKRSQHENGKKCSNCGYAIGKEYNYCSNCKNVLRKRCGRCGKMIDINWRKCPYCE